MSNRVVFEYLRIFMNTPHIDCQLYAKFYGIDVVDAVNRIHFLYRSGYLFRSGFYDGYPSYKLSVRGREIVKKWDKRGVIFSKRQCPHCQKSFYERGEINVEKTP